MLPRDNDVQILSLENRIKATLLGKQSNFLFSLFQLKVPCQRKFDCPSYKKNPCLSLMNYGKYYYKDFKIAFSINYSIIFSLQVYCSHTNNKFLSLYFLDVYTTLYCNVDSTRHAL